MQFVMPEGTKYVNIYPRLYSHGIIYYDDIEFHKVKEIPPFTMDSKSMLYTDWRQGQVQLTANHLAAGDTYDIKIKYGEDVVFEETVPAQEYLKYVFPISLLENYGKEYTLEVAYVDASGNVLQTETDDMYRFDRPTALTIDGQCIDGNGNIFYPVLGYHVLYEDFEMVEKLGATLFKITANADYSGLKATKYDDLQGFEWARNAVATVEKAGIVNDMGLTKYAPEKNITRADFAGYLIRTLGLTADATDTFADVDDSYYYAKEIAIGKALGILNGVGDNKYEPDAPISRQDLMVICTRGMKLVKELNLDTSKLNAFADSGLIADYAREGITGMVTEGIVKGNTDGRVNPLGNTTRAEAAVIMDRILNWK